MGCNLMPNLNSTDYYEQRERCERDLAACAKDPMIAAIHREMANLYSDLIGQASRSSLPPGMMAQREQIAI